MIPGLGALIRMVRGVAEGMRLDAQLDKLKPTAGAGVLDLVPETFRDCARLRLLAAQHSIAPDNYKPYVGAELVQAYNEVREEAIGHVMADAERETATKADMVRLVHSMDELARATRTDVATLVESNAAAAARIRALEAKVTQMANAINWLTWAAMATAVMIVFLLVR